ncbi:hypothetical protein RUM44_010202 [Polyplax serrata]|uniref:Uncharacterized protein n=1 Tax=Polyplax serrata TaxID=468196 RepID=A0ABR1AV54_POLSC
MYRVERELSEGVDSERNLSFDMCNYVYIAFEVYRESSANCPCHQSPVSWGVWNLPIGCQAQPGGEEGDDDGGVGDVGEKFKSVRGRRIRRAKLSILQLTCLEKMKALKWRDEARKNPVKDNEDVQCGESKNVFGRMSTFHMLSRWMDFV